MSIALPRLLSLEAAAQVICNGVVVRSTPSNSTKGNNVLLAVAISGYRLERRDEPADP